MKFNKWILIGLFLFVIVSFGTVSANENITSEIADQTVDDTSCNLEVDTSDDVVQTGFDEDILMEDSSSAGEDLDVEVTNVFHGYENTITVRYPNATGSVDITVGDKTYNSNFTNGKAIQVISDYNDGVNNVSVKYNNLTKLASFKVLDGIVTYKNFYDYFNADNSYKFHDYIPEGVTLDFQGNITFITLNKTEDFNILSININKPVNIISTTNDAFIDFNGKAGSLLGEYQGSTFTISNGGSWSNVTGITIHNTQVWIYNTHHVTLDRIRVLVEDARIGSGVGATSVRANSTWCTVKNSYFYTRNNGGSSSLVMAWADYCTFDNNTVVGEGKVGNLIYLTTYNVDFPVGVIPNCHNNITNNRMYGPSGDSNICWMLVISGGDTLLLNNTMIYKGDGIMNQWVDTSWYGGDAVPVGNKYIGNKMYGGCGMKVSGNSIAYDNIVGGEVTLSSNVTFYNNTVESLKIPGANNNNTVIYNNTIKKCSVVSNKVLNNTPGDYSLNLVIHDNIIDSLTIYADNITFYNNLVGSAGIDGGSNIQINNSYFKSIYLGNECINLTFTNNTVDGMVYVFSNDNTIIGNKINAIGDYAIDLKKTSGNIVANNYLLSSKEFGNSAVKFTNENIIKDNYPIAPDVLINVELIDNFENIVTITVPNSTGAVTIEVSDRKYTLTLESGAATQRILGLDPGNYNLTVKYQDDKSPIYATNATSIRVPKIDTYIFQVPVTEYIEGNVKLSITLPSDADGKVVINNIYQFDVVNGNCSAVLDLTEGEYDITVEFTNSSRYADKSIQVHIKVNHNPESVLTLADVSTYYLSGKVTAKLTDYNNSPIANVNVTISINGKIITALTDKDGVAVADYSLGVGTYKISADFKGNDNYNFSSAEATLKVLSRFSANRNIVMNYYDGSKYSVRVFDDNGKFAAGQSVSFNINGKKSAVKTDKNGYATLTITNLPGKYTLTATYKGHSVKNTIQVKQNLKTSKVTVKKSAKSFVLKATLSKVKGKKLTFKFKGKKYTAKTDKNGVAKVTIKKNVIKMLKKGKKYTFTVKYVSNTVKNKVIVK